MAECIRVNEDTWRFEDDFVRFLLLCGTEKALLVDSGVTNGDAKALAEQITDLPLFLINTHADPDHIAGNGAFGKIYMNPAEEENYRARGGGKGEIVPVREGDVIDLGGRPLEIIDIPGHTPGSIAILDKKHRALISGDTVQDEPVYMFGKYRNMPLLIKSLEHLGAYDGQYDEIWPSHGSFPVYQDLIPKLMEGAREIQDGKAKGEVINVRGDDVMLYVYPYGKFIGPVKEA